MDAPPSPPSGPRWRPRRWQLWLAAALLFALGVRVALPAVARSLIESQGSAALGVPITLANVDLGLLRARVALEGLVIGAPGAATPLAGEGAVPAGEAAPPLLRCARIAVRLGPLGLLRRELHVRSLEIDAPELHLERAADGSLVLPTPPPSPEPPAEQEPESDAAPFAVVLDALALRALRTELLEARGAAARSIELELAEFTLADVALRDGALSLGAIGIRGPKLQVRHDLLLAPRAAPAPAKPEPAAAPGEPDAPAPPLRLAGLEIERAELVLASGEAALPMALSLSVRELPGDAPAHQVALHVELAEGTLDVEGRASQSTLGFDGRVRWSNLSLRRILAVGVALPIRQEAGQSTGELQVRAALAPAQGPPGVSVSGSVALRGVRLEDTAGDFGVAFASLEVAADEVWVPVPERGAAGAAPPLRVSLSRVALQQPDLRVRRPAPAEAASEPAAAPEASGSPSAPPEISARNVSLRGGRVAFSDPNVRPAVQVELRDIALAAEELAWPERRVRGLVFSARGPGAASYKVSGSLAPEGGAIELALGGVPLATANSYLTPLGLSIQRGTLSLDGGVRARGERTSVDTRLRVAALDLSDSGGGLATQLGVPLEVGVALLKDTRGVIDLPLVFRVERGEMRMALTGTLLAALQRAVAGALVAPLRGLGGAVGALGGAMGGALGLGIDPLPAVAGQSELDPAAAPRLDELRATLAERPVLALSLRGRAGPEDDPFLAERMLAERTAAGDELPELSEAGFLARRRIRGALVARARGDVGELDAEDAELLRRAAATLAVPPERRAALATARAEAARTALLAGSGLGPERVTLGETEEGSPGVALALAAAGS